jgi:leader peptidase (prepilin peptidase)/N-methyltransferase
MPDPVLAVGTAILAGLVVVLTTGPVLRWLPEPAPDMPDADVKVRYADLATRRFVTGVAGLSAGAVMLSWAVLPRSVQPAWLVLATVGMLIAAVDGVTTWLPRRLTTLGWLLMLVAVGTTAALSADPAGAVRALVGAAIAGGLYLLIWAGTRGGFGFGDVRFAPLLGSAAAAHSWRMLLTTLVFGTVLGALHGLYRALRRRPAEFPYAPSMLAGAYLAATWARLLD